MGRHNVGAGAASGSVVPKAVAAVVALAVVAGVWVAVDRTHDGHAAAAAAGRSHSTTGGSAGPGSADPKSSGSANPAAGSDCTSLRVVTAASMAPAIERVASTVGTGAGCVAVHVTVADGENASKVVVSDHADVWIPDDSSWLNLPVAATLAPGEPPVVATSPLYFVTPKGVPLPATARGWLTLGDTLAKRGKLTLVLSDPAASGSALLAAGAITDAGFDAHGPVLSALGLMRTWQSGHTVAGVAPAFPTTADQVGIVPEYALLGGAEKNYTVTVPEGEESAYLRYTWNVTASGKATHAAGLARLEAALTSTSGEQILAQHHLRPADHSAIVAASDVAPSLPDPAGEPTPVIAQHYLYHVLTTFHPDRRKANILVVIDVSGSMRDLAPNSDTPLIDLVRSGIGQLTGLMPSTSHIGLWEFGSKLNGNQDYEPVVSTGLLTAGQRTTLNQAAAGLQARSTGTGLYQTMLAAYRQQQKDFQPGMPNEVLIFTDGKDQDDPGSISLATLRTELAAADPKRRVQLSVLGFGDVLPVAALTKAVAPVDGQVERLTQTAEVVGAFVHAVSGSLSPTDPSQ